MSNPVCSDQWEKGNEAIAMLTRYNHDRDDRLRRTRKEWTILMVEEEHGERRGMDARKKEHKVRSHKLGRSPGLT
jgi:hypothetical protein